MSNYFQGWIDAERSRRDAIVIRKVFLDLCGNNYNDAAILDQIVYWHEPNVAGERKLTIFRDGHWWLAKRYADWMEECRVNASTARSCIERIEKLGVIVTATYHFNGVPTLHIRIDPEGFEGAMKSLSARNEQVAPSSDGIDQVEVSETDTSYIAETTPPTTKANRISSWEERARTSEGVSKDEAKPGRPDPSPLEKLILERVKGLVKNRLPVACADVLSKPAKYLGDEYPSPEKLFASDPGFKAYVESRIQYGLDQRLTIQSICNSIANYGARAFGWLDWKHAGPPASAVAAAEPTKRPWWDMPTEPDGFEIKRAVAQGEGGWFVVEKLMKDGVQKDSKAYFTRPTQEEAIAAYRAHKSL